MNIMDIPRVTVIVDTCRSATTIQSVELVMDFESHYTVGVHNAVLHGGCINEQFNA